ncbi:Cystathionine beta-lyase family protein involved in aluminum resistance [Prochlorococcus marinus str. MIT 9515]|uniref:Cystathionine beta-lyase family protein involved in aluminum resistance n=1 Tax=Prochlorococcus marinus (strain MIT 9515) TaxID=167542 RepID=A2BZ56_PROM5|nr:methionine gamma-lyase family protein [Prochlorococcus marinus]ABM73067.1 Cystathionine beta-lyase family protein involved in aluminum resistance [Prochlorococcus marinus str. MIT 9515]
MKNNKNYNFNLAKEMVIALEEDLKDIFHERSNQIYDKLQNILRIFNEEKVSTIHFNQSTGSGHDDLSRQKIDDVFAKFFLAEKSAVRMQFVSGTHAISSVLFGILRPGDLMLSVTGNPYDTLEEVIGIRGKGKGSLLDLGVEYRQISIDEKTNSYDEKLITFFKNNKCKLVFIQKSCGYSWRKSLNNNQIKHICNLVHSLSPGCICFVDNCYGELVEESEPITNGANIIAGSLIKNLGGTIVPTGGYIAGDSELVEMACCRLTAPGIGADAGINFGCGRLILQGLFLAPQMVHESLKGADLVAAVFQKLGFMVLPKPKSYRSDIIQAVRLNNPHLIQKVCQSFQNSSPIDSFLSVIPSPMSGYDSNLLMSGGTFIEGSTSEFSADAPLRDPYNIFVQGGSHMAHIKIALIQLVFELLEENLIERESLIFS